MSGEIDGYCRLCAEPRRTSEMLSPGKDIVANSKVITKLSWINIDITSTDGLPNTICYACLDLLERTWSFLNNVRAAQEKLITLFLNTPKDNAYEIELDNKDYNNKIPGKPVDENWAIFQELKREIKIENLHDNVPTLYPNATVVDIKHETNSDGDNNVIMDSNDDHLSTDSDVPLKQSVKKKRSKSKHKKSKDRRSKTSYNATNSTWDDQACICAKCDANCQSILLLQLHSLQIHDCCCVFKCTQCSKVFPSYRSFIRHTRTHNKALQHCCEFCNRSFTYLPDLSSHKMKYHKTVYKTKCSNCGANFDTPEELDEHKNLFNKNSKLKRISNGEDQIEHKCDQCSKVFKSRANLHQHKQLHTERKKDFACHVCGKMFYTKGTLGTHLVVHEEKRPFKCNHCPLAFRAKGNLISHLSLHSGLKPFICEQCGKSFRVKRHLVSHSIIHTDLRPYVCEYCNKSFRFKTRLNLHLRQHTGVRPYKCIYCQRDFTNGSNYKKHMKRRHGIDTSTRLTSKIVSKKEITVINETIAQ
ncbi:zinc finger protein 184-like [Maniola jurtina]|uniref:zinc finger protein 184-like n=1 Tax=Maniola jurtina TaxID=191418 RepID=UPI001E6866F8|nr:zinc finger protein 184-like [Maniola jurtina]